MFFHEFFDFFFALAALGSGARFIFDFLIGCRTFFHGLEDISFGDFFT